MQATCADVADDFMLLHAIVIPLVNWITNSSHAAVLVFSCMMQLNHAVLQAVVRQNTVYTSSYATRMEVGR